MRKFIIGLLVVSGVSFGTGSAFAQDAPARTGRAQASPLSPELQKALETGKFGRARSLLNPGAGGPQANTQLAAKPKGPSKYVCAGAQCTCAGAHDCVQMIAADKKCKDGPDDVGCNDSGCTCNAK